MRHHNAFETLDARYAANLQRAVSQELPVLELIASVDDLGAYGRPDLARELYRVWIEHNPTNPLLAAVQFNYGTLLLAAGALPEAQKAFRATIELRPDFMSAHLNLGSALEAQGNIAGAVTQWLSVVQHLAAISSESVAHKTLALKQIGRVCEQVQDYQQAEEALRQSLDLNPQQRDVAEHWIVLRQMQCKWPIIEPWQNMSRLALIDGISPLLLARLSDTPMLQLAVAYKCFRNDAESQNTSHTVGFWPTPEGPRPTRLRIGYVCSDMRAHALGSLIVGLFEWHDRERFEIFAYYTGPDVQDAIRARIENAVDHWRDIAKLSNKHAAAQVVKDRVDILIDLNGYTDGGRPGLFALRPAPIIVNWLGYPGTMGTAHHQYIIADNNIVPPNLEKYYSEAVRRLPCYQPNDCHRPIDPCIRSRADMGLPDAAMVYCCFNSTAKISQAMFQHWMTILKQVPHAVLWLLSASDAINSRLQQMAAQAGVEEHRLVFAERRPPAEHLVRYKLADLFLDTFPYGAHTTASDALWMGLPVVTLMGRSFASRVCGSLVRSVGLSALATQTPEEYVETAIRFGSDREMLQEHRQKIEENRSSCLLFDTAKLVSNIENIFDGMWDDYKSGQLPVPDLLNLDHYAEIGKTRLSEIIDDSSLDCYEQNYRTAMAYRHALSAIPRDQRLWNG
jgi:predicted O-linked N-acetylglucosamine transferase (SPINDLY family)